MKFKTTSQVFSDLLTAAVAHSTKNSASIGGFFLLEVKDGRLTVKAECVGSGFKGSIAVKSEEDGSVCVVADKLQSFVAQIAQMGDVEISVKTTEKNTMIVESTQTMPKTKISLRTRGADTFPESKECPAEKWGEVEVGLFATALQHVAVVADKENPLEIRKSVHIEQSVKPNEETGADETVLTFVATNGRSLGTESYALKDGKSIPELKAINIPSTSVPKILAITGKDDKGGTDEPATAGIAVHDGKVFFKVGDIEIYISLYSDNYCSWERVIPVDTPETPIRWIELDEKEFSRTLALAGITADAKSKMVTIDFSTEGTKVSSMNEDKDFTEQVMDLKVEGNPISFNFNRNLLTVALKGLEGPKEPGDVPVKIGCRSSVTSVLLKRVDGKGPLYVIMPMVDSAV